MTIKELVDNFALFDEWEDKYSYLIKLGGDLPPMDEALKTDSARVQGCMSQVWMLLGWGNDGRLTMMADSDAQIVRGLISILRTIFVGRTKEEAASVSVPDIFGRLGLDQHLSPNRRNGFFSMTERIQRFVTA